MCVGLAPSTSYIMLQSPSSNSRLSHLSMVDNWRRVRQDMRFPHRDVRQLRAARTTAIQNSHWDLVSWSICWWRGREKAQVRNLVWRYWVAQDGTLHSGLLDCTDVARTNFQPICSTGDIFYSIHLLRWWAKNDFVSFSKRRRQVMRLGFSLCNVVLGKLWIF